MQNYCKTIGALAAASALVAGNAKAIEIDYQLHTGYTSEYIWRGINLGQDLVEVGLNASTEWNGFGFSAGAWYGSIQSAPGFGAGADESYNELDLYIEASRDFGFAEFAIGYIWYHFPNSWPVQAAGVDDAQELYFSVARDFDIFNASFTYFWDIETDNDGYMELALDRSFEINECLAISVGSTLGYLAERGKLCQLTLKAALDYGFAENATFSPFIAHSWALTENPGHGGSMAYVGSKNQIFGGAMVSVQF